MKTTMTAAALMLIAALTSGCATDSSRSAPVDTATAQLSAGMNSQRNRDSVRAEAVQAAQQHRATLLQDIDYFHY